MLYNIQYYIATVCGIGRMQVASGTWGTLAGFPLILLWQYAGGSQPLLITSSLFLFFIGVWASSAVAQKIEDKDPSIVVIDEVVGFLVAFWGHTFSWAAILFLFLAFRCFDIFKPFPVKNLEYCPRGWGIMADDVMAGVYANVVWAIINIFM